jgi:hypothetical protein
MAEMCCGQKSEGYCFGLKVKIQGLHKVYAGVF